MRTPGNPSGNDEAVTGSGRNFRVMKLRKDPGTGGRRDDMATMQCSFLSNVLGMVTELTVIVPDEKEWGNTGRYPVIYLLHGLTDGQDSWLQRTALARYCEEYRIAAVMPGAARSFYTDMAYGMDYFTFISEEVPSFCEAMFPIGGCPEKRFIAGNSMGGYGAVKTALKKPGMYAKAAAFSGVMDINSMMQAFPELEKDWICCFGGNEAPQEEDLFFLTGRAQENGTLMPIYQYCGTGDFLYRDNLRFLEYCRERQIPVTYRDEEGGTHDWVFWDDRLPKIIKWFLDMED